MLRRVARAAIEMHLMDGRRAALEGRPVITEVKCFVPVTSAVVCVCARAIDQTRFMTDPDRRG